MADKPYDPTLKDLVEAGPDDWPVLTGQPQAPTEVIDADIATVSGAGDKVLRVRAEPPYLLHWSSRPATMPLDCRASYTCAARCWRTGTSCGCGRWQCCCGRKPTRRP